MAVKLGFSIDDLYYFSIKDITEMFEIYSDMLSDVNKGGRKSKKYVGAEGLLDFVRGNK